MFSLFEKKNYIGIDIGTSNLKLVQLSVKNNRFVVENYVIAENKNFVEEGGAKKLDLKLLDDAVAAFIREALKRAKISKAKEVIVSIPSYLAFITVIEMPVMSAKELETAVQFEARQHIPIPIEEVILDWQNIGTAQKMEGSSKTEVLEILLVAVPSYLVKKYEELISRAGLVLKDIELENFSLIRSILGNDKSTVMIIDFGAQSTDINLVSDGILRDVRTLDANGLQMTRSLSKALNISGERAEFLKKERGLKQIGGEGEFAKVILPSVDVVVEEIKRMQRNFSLKKKKTVERIILTGGVASMPGLVEYFNSKLEMEVGAGNPFKRMIFPQELNREILEISPMASIATGLAMRGAKKDNF